MVKLVAITPDWDRAPTFFPTDTLRPPPSFPIEWGYLQAEVKRRGIEPIEYIDEYLQPGGLEASGSKFQGADFVIVLTTPSYLFWRCPPLDLAPVRRVLDRVRLLTSAPTVLVGPHGTVSPMETVASTGASYAFRGEPDNVLLDDLARILEGASPQSLWSSENDQAQPSPQAGGLGRVAYDEVLISLSSPHTWVRTARDEILSWGGNHALLESARGCSFDCPFCMRTGFRESLRLKDLDTLACEVDELVSFGVSYVYLIDENFGIPRSHAQSVAALLKSRNLRFGIQTRPDIWTESSIGELATAGCVYVELGVEALDSDLMRDMGKYRNTERTHDLIGYFRETIPYVGINSFDIANPDLGIQASGGVQLDIHGDAVLPFVPYPGTPWGDRALGAYRLRGSWENVSKVHALYTMMSRKGPVAAALRRSLMLRRATLVGLSAVKAASSGNLRMGTRHQRLGGRRGT